MIFVERSRAHGRRRIAAVDVWQRCRQLVPLIAVTGGTQTVDCRYYFDSRPGVGAPNDAHVYGRMTGSSDRGQRTMVDYDERGRADWSARQMALIPNVGTSKPIASVGNRQRRQPRSRSERARQTNAMQPLFAPCTRRLFRAARRTEERRVAELAFFDCGEPCGRVEAHRH
ncbi:MAG: hypothetical protein GY772_13265, partial [bacterium]|nr:hypothetical protein [bacterium]